MSLYHYHAGQSGTQCRALEVALRLPNSPQHGGTGRFQGRRRATPVYRATYAAPESRPPSAQDEATGRLLERQENQHSYRPSGAALESRPSLRPRGPVAANMGGRCDYCLSAVKAGFILVSSGSGKKTNLRIHLETPGFVAFWLLNPLVFLYHGHAGQLAQDLALEIAPERLRLPDSLKDGGTGRFQERRRAAPVYRATYAALESHPPSA